MSLKDLKKQMDNLVENMKKNIRPLLIDEAKRIFGNHPEMDSFGVVMFADYFNDGDICPFFVRDWPVVINGSTYYEETGEDEEPWIEQASVDVSNFANIIPNEVAEQVWGQDTQLSFKINHDTGEVSMTVDNFSNHD